MAFLEIGARLGACFFLVWCLFAHRLGRAGWARTAALLSFTACGFGVLGDLKGIDPGALAVGVLLGSAALGVSLLVRPGATGTAQRLSTWPVVAAAVGFFTGQGTLIVAVVLTGLFVLLEGRGDGRGGAVGLAAGGVSVLRIKAQSIRGVIGRVEGVLERLGVKPLYMAVDHDSTEKELTIVTEFAPPPGLQIKALIAALGEIEGVIQFAVE
jgi:hypothetical protein